MLHRYR